MNVTNSWGFLSYKHDLKGLVPKYPPSEPALGYHKPLHDFAMELENLKEIYDTCIRPLGGVERGVYRGGGSVLI